MTGPRSDREAGFTLADLLVGFAIAALVLGGATTAFLAGTRVLEFGLDQAAAQQTARAALERLAREIRWAGYGHANPLTGSYDFTAITAQTATSLILQNDFDGDGVLDAPPGPCDPTAVTELARYRLLGTDLMRSENPDDPACDVVVASGITGLTFLYSDSAGHVTTDPAAIRSVDVTMNVTSHNGATERTIAMRDQVRIRNR
jgi:type II secretory pathway component PulJ